MELCPVGSLNDELLRHGPMSPAQVMPGVVGTGGQGAAPADAQTFDQDIVKANPAVRAVCSVPALLASRRGVARQIPARDWEIQVLPPDEASFDSGARAYRCIANLLIGNSPTTSQFGTP